MEFLEVLFRWLNDAAVKSVLLFLGGLVLKHWAPFVNKAIPVTLLVVSAILAALRSAFPDHVPDAVTGSFVFTTVAGLSLESAASTPAKVGSWLWNTLGPLAYALATHTGAKNTGEWIKIGVGIIWPGGRAPAK